ncbi:hypothetical protein QVD17_29555 [Tagetes erecta]|uniref:Uncharacterized protein n=1 Tax=Tagetes erecta TaxID=13708 RepID=A0AAD8K180_TARER|nr:hypothetical protein QVD17_29555 [Tagetes erecta]
MPEKLSMGIFTESDHNFGPGDFFEYFMTPRKNRINESSPELSRDPFEILLLGPQGWVHSVQKKLSMESDHNFGPGDFFEYFMTPRKNRINESSPELSRDPFEILLLGPQGWVLETSFEYFMTPRKNRINENSPELSRDPFEILLLGPLG